MILVPEYSFEVKEKGFQYPGLAKSVLASRYAENKHLGKCIAYTSSVIQFYVLLLL